MSAKNRDNKNRWRNITVGFRVSPEESEQINKAVRLSGLSKQDYITRRLLCQDVVVQGNAERNPVEFSPLLSQNSFHE